jgi:hypothetical protein
MAPKEQRLRELLQLPPAAALPPAEVSRPDEYWDETFLRLGRGWVFEPDAGEFPVDHSRLMEELLRLVSPWLAGARFSQVLPGQGDLAGEGWGASFGEEDREGRGVASRYTLRLMHEGRRYGVTFHDSSEYYNLNAVLALLNAALDARGTSLRLFGLGNVVLLGPLGGLQQALREGFIPGFEGEGIYEEWELEAIDAWCESGDTPESLARQLEKGLRRVQVSLVV